MSDIRRNCDHMVERVMGAFNGAQTAAEYEAAKELAGSKLTKQQQLTVGIDAAIACRARLMAEGVL